jgi:hypothetical protein
MARLEMGVFDPSLYRHLDITLLLFIVPALRTSSTQTMICTKEYDLRNTDSEWQMMPQFVDESRS